MGSTDREVATRAFDPSRLCLGARAEFCVVFRRDAMLDVVHQRTLFELYSA